MWTVIDEDFRVAHHLSLKGIGDSAALALATGLPAAEVERRAAALVEGGSLEWHAGPTPGWQLTAAGRERNHRTVESALADTDRAVVEGCHAEFVPLNQELLETCTAWQLRDSVGGAPDGEGRSPHERATIGRLRALDSAIQPIVSKLGARLSWFDQYPRRLRSAIVRVEAGQAQWFTNPLVDSYHTVWFELHEDLLSTLGLQRSS